MKQVTLLDCMTEFTDNLDVVSKIYEKNKISIIELVHDYMEFNEIDRTDIYAYIDIQDEFIGRLKADIFNDYMTEKLN